VAVIADLTAYHVWYVAAKPKSPNGRKCRVWTRHGYVTTLPIPEAEISAVWFFVACYG